MKVLFAVNSESISEAIIKKYQKDYREILSYKNVYYFNAIIKEIQKDKSYDRIIISEDLEPFSNNNYESIDKFVFEKLDGISDEAHDTQGNEISIILICSDRHTKGSSFLVKIFGIGVYNALLGNDRSMEEVCRLINKPRTKKEAKMYYKIDTDDVNYRAENENEVSELEIQNILAHFKKLGRNTEKYAASFENIAAQYTDEQLKIIINCLPLNVKAILEETSTKYQEIMAVNGRLIRGVRSSNIETKQDQKRTGVKIDIIENKLNQTKTPQSIVIPNSVKKTGIVAGKKAVQPKVNPLQTSDEQMLRKPKTMQNSNVTSKKAVQNKIDANDDLFLKKENTVKTVKPERRVPVAPARVSDKVMQAQPQPKKQMFNQEFDEFDDIEMPQFDVTPQSTISMTEEPMQEPVKRGRGRPRIKPLPDPTKPKGKRGRPRKNPIEEPMQMQEINEPIEQDELPDLDTITETELNFNDNFTENTFDGLDEIEENTNELFDMSDFEDTNFENLDNQESVMDFEDLVESDEETEKVMPNEEFDMEWEQQTEEVELPELDELDDVGDAEDDEFLGVVEEAFDEFEDYDEYGAYQTKAKVKQQAPIDELYQEDILKPEQNQSDLQEVVEEEVEEFDSFDMESFDTAEEDDDSNLLLDFNDDDDLLSELDENAEIENIEENFETTPEPIDNFYENNDYQENFDYGSQNLETIKSPIDYSMSNLNSLMTKDKKIVTFLGTTKNGVSFLVNNLAEIFASVGIDTAILDMTKNRNSYYIYTQNEEALRKIAYTSLEKLQGGMAEGIQVKQNLTVYTALPNDGKDYGMAEPILSTLVQNHSLVLIDCDFDTNPSYFASCQEIYLVQSMDILTIQPLTAFLRDLKTQGVLEPEKVRVVINKELKVRGLTNKAIIGGMSFYNDPAMSFMTELFNKDTVTYCSIPFDETVYSNYLEAMLNCRVSIGGYPKNFTNKLKNLGEMVYPLTSRQTYSGGFNQNYGQNKGGFSNSMNNTLNKMRKKY